MKMTCFLLCLSLVAAISLQLMLPLECVADVIWLKDIKAPLSGKILERSESEIRFQIFENGKIAKPIQIATKEILQFVINIDADRLTKLRPDSPKAYRDYAEELAAQKKDPYAIELARRLFLIAAFHSEGDLRLSAISGLLQLADSESERRDLQILLFLSNAAALPPTKLTSVPGNEAASKEDQQLMLGIVRNIRMGAATEAQKALSAPGSNEVVERWSDHVDLEELLQMTRSNRISKVQLSKLLDVELDIIQTGSNTHSVKREKWSDFAIQKTNSTILIPTFENLIGFDPEESIYKDGKWTKPTQR